jgi:3-hydroxypropanoate dehydrogenase
MSNTLDNAARDLIFRKARTFNGFTPEKIPETLLREIYDLAKMGPTSANTSPARFIFVVSKEAKEKLKPCLAEGNVAKTMEAPVTVIIGHDTQFYEHLPELFPHAPGMKAYFTSSEAVTMDTAFRNGTLQGAYLIIAARALGLDAGPMSGFDPAKVNAAFWPDGRVKANFLCNLGIGDKSKVFDRNPRLSFEKACQIV